MQRHKKARFKFGPRLTTISELLSALLCGVVFNLPGAAAPTVVETRLLVKPKPKMAEAAVQSLFAAHGAKEESVIKQIDVRIVSVRQGRPSAVMEAFNHNPNIEFAELDDRLPPENIPNDPYYSFEWHLSKIGAPAAWNMAIGSSNVTIAILDSGVVGTHPDLAPVLVPGWNFFDNNSNASDVNGHGTAVAGAAAAMVNNGVGVASIAWGCMIMPVRVSDTNGFASLSVIASGLTWSADQGVRVANISFNASGSLTVRSAAQYFQSKGGVVAVSAGNNGTFNSSADNPYVLTVSATGTDDMLASFSNTGNNIDVSAPGVDVLTTAVGGNYGLGTGTSFSAPIIAGVAALVISANPSLTGVQVQDIIKQSADDLGTVGWDTSYGWGRVNAYKAVLAAGQTTLTDTTPPVAMVTAPVSGSSLAGIVAISISATDEVGIARVECHINGALTGTSTNASAVFSWDTRTFTNGSYTLQARAYDAVGNVGSSAVVTVSILNLVPDVTPPTAQITSPTTGTTIAGLVSINVDAIDDVGVAKVECYLNETLAATSASAPAAFSWDTTTYANGSYTLQARAYDAAGNMGSSTDITVTVQNLVPDGIAPTVQITSPTNGTVVVGKIMKVYVTATDNVGVSRVDLLVDGKFFSSSASAAPVFDWNTSKIIRGSHTLVAVAYDSAGNSTRSTVVTVRK